LIITDKENVDVFRPFNSRILIMPSYVPDEGFFIRKSRPKRARPLIGYIGKINYYWENKCLVEILEAVNKVIDGYDLVL
jgi:hypothetical protein